MPELEDFDLLCRVLEGGREPSDELVTRGTIPAACAVSLAVSWLVRHGCQVKDAAAVEPQRAPFELFSFLLADERRMLRGMPDGATLKEWLGFAALELARSRIVLQVAPGDDDAAPQASLPLVASGSLPARVRLALALLAEGCGAPGLALTLGMGLPEAAELAYESRRAALGAPADEAESPCGTPARTLGALLDGALPAKGRASVKEHASRCPACHRRLKRLRGATHALPRVPAIPARACPSLADLYRWTRRTLPPRPRDEVEEHLTRCLPCRLVVLFDRVFLPTAPAVAVQIPAEAAAEGRRRFVEAACRPMLGVGFGINDEVCRVLYTSGRRGRDLFVSERRVLLCEGASIDLQGIQVQVKCLPEAGAGDERCSLGIVFQGMEDRLPVFLDLEGEGEKQVTLREGAADFRFVRHGSHMLRFGRWKGVALAIDVRPYRIRFDDLLAVADGLQAKAEESSGTALEIVLFYRVADLVLRAAAERPGSPRALLRLLRAYLSRPVPRVDAARLASAGRARAADRSAFVRFLAGGPVRALSWIRSASARPELGDALRPLAAVQVAWEARDRGRMLEAVSNLRAAALPQDPETDRFARSLAEWLSEPGRDHVREDLVLRLGIKYVDGLVARFDADPA